MPDCSMSASFEMSNGTKNYEKLENKPSINGVELIGDKTSAELGLATSAQGALAESALQEVPSYYVTETELASELSTKQNVITDLSEIREGASLGATSIQPADIAGMVTSVNGIEPINGNVTITIPSQVNADWNATSGVAKILNKPTIPTDTGDLTNNAGYIKGISSLDVTNALGYVPYNSSNPNNYITSSALNGYATENWVVQQDYLTGITGSQVTNALGYTPVNPSNLSDVATSGSYNDLNNKPTIGNGTVTFTQGGATKGTITMNQSGNTTIEFEQGGGSGTITDVEVNGESVVTDGVAEIDLSGYQTKLIASTDLEIVPLLPSGHTQLKSITATGSQYINTGIWLTDNFKAVIIGRFTDTTGTQCVLGATMPTSAATYKNIVLAKDASRYFVNNGNPWLTNQTNSSASLDTNRHTFVVEITSSSTKISIDNTTNTGNYSNVTLDEDLFLFARNAVNASPAITDFAKFELEAIMLYNNGELVFNGIPDKYGNKAGLYDTITSTFMPSLSATDFVAGEEIATQNVINFTNETGYITGIDSTDVVTALGYTPYNATNPNGYITSSALNGYATQTWVGQQGYLTSITSAQVTNALGYTPYNSTNPNGYISSASVSSLTDVILTSPTNGQGLVYNSTSQRWENGTVSATGQVTIKDWTV